jgi:hypothetical protein
MLMVTTCSSETGANLLGVMPCLSRLAVCAWSDREDLVEFGGVVNGLASSDALADHFGPSSTA